MTKSAHSPVRRALLARGGALALLFSGMSAAQSAVLGSASPQSAGGASILDVRIWPSDDYTRLTIESGSPIEALYQLMPSPLRMAVDIQGVQATAQLKQLANKVNPKDPNIGGIRVGQYSPGVVRLVIDLKRAIKPQVFTLAPVASYKYRLVFDLMPENPVDPLQALIAQRLEANPGEPAPQDPAMQPSPAVGDGGGNALANQPEEPQDNSHLVQTPTPQLQVPGSSADDSELMAGMAPNSRRSSVFDRFKPSRWGSRGQQPRYERNERYERYERYGQQPQQRYSYPSIRTPRRDSQRLIVIALDPGHGGEDPGAIGPGGTREKDVVLRIAQRLRNRLNSMRVGDTQVRAFLTRDSDFFVPLDMRVAKARRVGARLFISIHADAFLEPSVRGAGVFALSEHGASSAAANWLANNENFSDRIGGVYASNARGSLLQSTLLDMSTTMQIRDSLRLGNDLLSQIGSFQRLHKGTVERAGFAVLKSPDIPSVLVETAFISNPEEEWQLRNADYQEAMASAIRRGVERYFAGSSLRGRLA